MNEQCLICNRIDMIKNHKNPYFVKELSTGYVVLADSQYFRGYTLFLAKEHVTELHLMVPEVKDRFMKEMSWVSEACSIAFGADKMNIEMLGNGDSHAHWHIVPRHNGDTPKPGPIWWVDPEVMYADSTAPSSEDLLEMKKDLNKAIDDVMNKYTSI
ncbi:HIT family protein [Companilactobacillus muriivasis]|uniref:HIT family protein n=1 Tax=Companilactobacillus muriivasis TaxID=3081444 RepID=UPI0030C6938B